MAAFRSTLTDVCQTAGPDGPEIDQRHVVMAAVWSVLLLSSVSVAQLLLRCSRGGADLSHSVPPTERELEPLLAMSTLSRGGVVARLVPIRRLLSARSVGSMRCQPFSDEEHNKRCQLNLKSEFVKTAVRVL